MAIANNENTMQLGLTIGDDLGRIEHAPERIEFVELSIGERSPNLNNVDTERLTALLQQNAFELTIHLPFKQVVSTPVPELNDAIVAYQRRMLTWASDLGAEYAVLHGTMRDPHDTDQRTTFADQLERITSAGDDIGVTVVVENVGHQAQGVPLTVLGDIAIETDTPICFDVGHAFAELGMDGIKSFLSRRQDQIAYLHIHDVRRRGDTHLPLGAGEIEYNAIHDHLARTGSPAAVEVFSDDPVLLNDTLDRVTKFL